MTVQSTTRYSYSYGWDLGEDNWKTGMDANFAQHDALTLPVATSATVTAQPGHVAGAIYLLSAGVTGADWAGNDGTIAYDNGTVWSFYTPSTYTRIWADDRWYWFNGTNWVGTWSLFGATPIVQPSSANQVEFSSPANADGAFTTISAAIGASYAQAEVQAIADECEDLGDDVRSLTTLVHAIRTALVDTGIIKGSA